MLPAMPLPTTSIIGTPICRSSYDEVLDLLGRRPEGPRARTAAFCTVHTLVEARDDVELRTALDGIDLTNPDGMPLVWAIRALGHRGQQRVYGPDLMLHALRHGVEQDWCHYFYGSTPETLEALSREVGELAPGAKVVGSFSPPFRPLSSTEMDDVVARIDASGADLVWVGLGMPKQEKFVHAIADRLPGRTLLAVGAAFDFHAGVVAQAPDWIQSAGLEWLFRLRQEPRRLWRRYARTNPRFVVLLVRQLLSARIRRRTDG